MVYIAWSHGVLVLDPIPLFLIVFGAALALAGFIQILRARRSGRLVTQGLYSIVRHPQHLGIIISTLGGAMSNLRPIDFSAWFTVMFLYLVLAGREEKGLEKSSERSTWTTKSGFPL